MPDWVVSSKPDPYPSHCFLLSCGLQLREDIRSDLFAPWDVAPVCTNACCCASVRTLVWKTEVLSKMVPSPFSLFKHSLVCVRATTQDEDADGLQTSPLQVCVSLPFFILKTNSSDKSTVFQSYPQTSSIGIKMKWGLFDFEKFPFKEKDRFSFPGK